jgi:hypothetical protein
MSCKYIWSAIAMVAGIMFFLMGCTAKPASPRSENGGLFQYNPAPFKPVVAPDNLLEPYVIPEIDRPVVAIVVPLKAWKKMADDDTPQEKLKTGDIKWSTKQFTEGAWYIWDGHTWQGFGEATVIKQGVVKKSERRIE